MDVLDAVINKYYASGTGFATANQLSSGAVYGELIDKLRDLDMELCEKLDSVVGDYMGEAEVKAYKQGFQDCFKLFIDMNRGVV